MRIKFEINVKIYVYIYVYVSCKMFIMNMKTLRKLRKDLNN